MKPVKRSLLINLFNNPKMENGYQQKRALSVSYLSYELCSGDVFSGGFWDAALTPRRGRLVDFVELASSVQPNAKRWGRIAHTIVARCKRRLIDITHLYITSSLTWACSPNITFASIYPRLRCACRWAEVIWAFSPQERDALSPRSGDTMITPCKRGTSVARG